MPEKKSWVEIFLMPIVIVGVGSFGTYLITLQQEKNALSQAESERQVKILEIFAEKITDKDEKQRLLAIKLLRALDDDLASKLASAVAEVEPDSSEMRKVATKLADVAKARIEHRPRIYLHVPAYDDKPLANKAERLLEIKGWVVPGIERVGVKSPAESQLRYFRQSELPVAEKIRKVLQEMGHDIALSYISGYEESTALKPMHFEVWFASTG